MAAVYTVRLDHAGGTGPSTAYFSRDGYLYYDATCSSRVSSVQIPTYAGYTFQGYFVNGSKVINESGYVSLGGWPRSNTIATARWFVVTYYVHFLGMGKAQDVTASIIYKQKIQYPQMTNESYALVGFYTSSEGGELVLPGTKFLQEQDLYLFARWESNYHTLTFNANGGTVSVPSRKVAYQGTVAPLPAPTYGTNLFRGWYTRPIAGERITDKTLYPYEWDSVAYAHWTRIITISFDATGGSAVEDQTFFEGEEIFGLPETEKEGYRFVGWYTAATGGKKVSDGDVLYCAQDTMTLYAHWKTVRTLTYNANGGSVSPGTASVIEGEVISCPLPTKSGYVFGGWYYQANGGAQYPNPFVYPVDSDLEIFAHWRKDVVDYFGFASQNLIPISSDSGDNKKRICVTNAVIVLGGQSSAGRYSAGADATSGIWRNPSVTYRVVGDLTFETNLGRAYAGSGSTVSGYFITSVEVNTAIGDFPTVTVSANANEGVDAINLFAVSIPIVAAAHPQNLMTCSSGGGELQACSLVASCDPVVCEENLMPCASDVVCGRIVANVETIATNDEAAPTASGGFVEIGAPVRGSDGMFPVYTMKAVKEIV